MCHFKCNAWQISKTFDPEVWPSTDDRPTCFSTSTKKRKFQKYFRFHTKNMRKIKWTNYVFHTATTCRRGSTAQILSYSKNIKRATCASPSSLVASPARWNLLDARKLFTKTCVLEQCLLRPQCLLWGTARFQGFVLLFCVLLLCFQQPSSVFFCPRAGLHLVQSCFLAKLHLRSCAKFREYLCQLRKRFGEDGRFNFGHKPVFLRSFHRIFVLVTPRFCWQEFVTEKCRIWRNEFDFSGQRGIQCSFSISTRCVLFLMSS